MARTMAVMKKVGRLLVPASIFIPFLTLEVSAIRSRPLPTYGPPAPQIRTFISGQGNDDNSYNSCTASQPCRTFAVALGLTIAGGQIFVLNSADYGPVMITKAVTITSDGAVAGVQATNGTGIKINAGANDIINLRGLTIDGGNTGDYGVHFLSGQALNIQKSTIRGFKTGLNFAPAGPSALLVSEAQLTHNRDHGVMITSGGSNAVSGAFDRVVTSWNGVGILAYGVKVSVMITELDAGNNTYGIGANAASVMVRNSTVGNNSVGMAADQASIIRIGQSAITANSTGWQATNGGQIMSYGNNNLNGNTSDGIPSATVALK